MKFNPIPIVRFQILESKSDCFKQIRLFVPVTIQLRSRVRAYKKAGSTIRL